MTISGIESVPQPERNNHATADNEKLERRAISIFNSLNKNGDDIIDEKDGVDKTMLQALKNFIGSSLTLANFKKVADKLNSFTYTKSGKYNGTKAKITYNIRGHIRSVNTGAKNAAEAREHMGLNKTHVVGVTGGDDMITYGREYKKDNGTAKEYFVWNETTKSMDFEWAVWDADDFNVDKNIKKTSNKKIK